MVFDRSSSTITSSPLVREGSSSPSGGLCGLSTWGKGPSRPASSLAVSDGYFPPVPSLVGSPSSSPEPDEAIDYAVEPGSLLHLSVRRASGDEPLTVRSHDEVVYKSAPLPSPPLVPLILPSAPVAAIASAVPRHRSPLSLPYNIARASLLPFVEPPPAPRPACVAIFSPEVCSATRRPLHRVVTRLRDEPYWDGCGCGCGEDAADDEVEGVAMFGLGIMVPASHSADENRPGRSSGKAAKTDGRGPGLSSIGNPAERKKVSGSRAHAGKASRSSSPSASLRRSKRLTA